MTRKQRKRLRKLRYKSGYNWHHRRPKSRGGGTGRNLVQVSIPRHVLWHKMFGSMTADEVAKELKEVWLEDGYQVIIRRPNEPMDSRRS